MRAAIFLLAVAGAGHAGEQWSRIASPNFELYTTDSEKAARDAIQHFEQVRGFFLKASPVRSQEGFPVRIVAFSGKQQFIPYSPNQLVEAYYAPGPKRDTIVMSDLSPRSYQVAVHEYMHLIVRHSGLRIPVWLHEGWADVYSSLRPVKDGVAIGDLIPGRMQALASGEWMDFQALAAVTPRSPVYNEGSRIGLFYGESWAMAHMLFLAPDYKDNFAKFVVALHRGRTLDEACLSAFGKSPGAVFEDLRAYFNRKKLYGSVFQTTLGKAEAETQRYPVSDFESRLVLADLQAAVGHLDLATREYQALEKLQPNQPDVAQALGYFALSRENIPLALTYLNRAFAAGSGDPQMCFTLAMLDRDAKEPPATIIPILERAVKFRPDFAEALFQLGLVRVAARQFEGGISALMSIQNVTPDRATQLFFALAYAYLETGDLAKARDSAGTAKQWVRTPADTRRIAEILDLIDARAQLPLPPRPGEKLQTVQGTLQSFDCSPDRNRLRLLSGSGSVSFVLPDSKAVEFSHPGGGSLEMACGPLKPLQVLIEYAPVSVMEQGSNGIVRRLEY